jgi:hypothetical protein
VETYTLVLAQQNKLILSTSQNPISFLTKYSSRAAGKNGKLLKNLTDRLMNKGKFSLEEALLFMQAHININTWWMESGNSIQALLLWMINMVHLITS